MAEAVRWAGQPGVLRASSGAEACRRVGEDGRSCNVFVGHNLRFTWGAVRRSRPALKRQHPEPSTSGLTRSRHNCVPWPGHSCSTRGAAALAGAGSAGARVGVYRHPIGRSGSRAMPTGQRTGTPNSSLPRSSDSKFRTSRLLRVSELAPVRQLGAKPISMARGASEKWSRGGAVKSLGSE